MKEQKITYPYSLGGYEVLPYLRLNITTLAPLLLAPKAIARPAPPAPTNTNNFPAIGETFDAWPLVFCLSVYTQNLMEGTYHGWAGGD